MNGENVSVNDVGMRGENMTVNDVGIRGVNVSGNDVRKSSDRVDEYQGEGWGYDSFEERGLGLDGSIFERAL